MRIARTKSIPRASQLRARWTSFAHISNYSAIIWTCTYASSSVELGIRAKKGFAKQACKAVHMQRKRRPPLGNNHVTGLRNQAICSCSLPRQNSANVSPMVQMQAPEKKTPKKRSPTSLGNSKTVRQTRVVEVRFAHHTLAPCTWFTWSLFQTTHTFNPVSGYGGCNTVFLLVAPIVCGTCG